MYDYGNADISEKGRDELAKLVVRRYREAVQWASTEHVGRASLRRVLCECHNQLHGILSPEDQKIAEDLGNDVNMNLTAMKCDTVHAFLLEMLTPQDELPWTISPTPIPDISETGRLEVLEKVKETLYLQEGTDISRQGIYDLAKKSKTEVRKKEKEEANRAAASMTRLMYDQCVEGNWEQALTACLYNFTAYPFGVLLGPVPTRGPRLAWVGDNVRVKEETYYKWESINPFDFWFSPDSRSTQDGTCVFVRRRMTRRQLLSMLKMKSYITNQVELVLADVNNADKYNLRWLSDRNPDQPDDQLLFWAQCSATIDALVHYGYFSGRELNEYCGMTGLDKLTQYNTTVTIIGGRTVQVFIAPDPTVNMRPVHTASFYKLSEERIPGEGIAQKLRDVERSFRAALRCLILNMSAASEPITEMDVNRLVKYMKKDTDGEGPFKLTPGGVYMVDNDMGMAQYPALRFFAVPSNMDQYRALLDHFMELAHLFTNIPAALHGTAVGTGANRTFRGASMLQSNAIKAIQAAVKQMDNGIFKPVGEMLYNYNMLYEKDPDIKGDCKVQAQGVAGLLAREIDANNAFDNLQIMGVLAGQFGPTMVPVLEWAIKALLKAKKVPDDLVDQMSMGSSQEQPNGPPQGEPQGPPPTAAGMGAPNPNPGPPVGGLQ
jgi:hypothetical protein